MARISATNRYSIPSTTVIEDQLLWNEGGVSETFILPEQVFSPVRVQSRHRGEVALLYAILDDAIRCYLTEQGKHHRSGRRLIQEAETWLFDDDEQWPFSFINVCEMLDLDPTWMRRLLRHHHNDSSFFLPPASSLDFQVDMDAHRPQANRSVSFSRFRRRCTPVRQLHGKERENK